METVDSAERRRLIGHRIVHLTCQELQGVTSVAVELETDHWKVHAAGVAAWTVRCGVRAVVQTLNGTCPDESRLNMLLTSLPRRGAGGTRASPRTRFNGLQLRICCNSFQLTFLVTASLRRGTL